MSELKFHQGAIYRLAEEYLAIWGTAFAPAAKIVVAKNLKSLTVKSCPLIVADSGFLVGHPFDVSIAIEESWLKIISAKIKITIHQPEPNISESYRIYQKISQSSDFSKANDGIHVTLPASIDKDQQIDLMPQFRDFLKKLTLK